jgi:conjugal transfer pilus assembly protein TraK
MRASSAGVERDQARRARRCIYTANVALLLFTALSGSPARALQTIEARDGVAVEAILSIREPTRIRIEGAPITDVFGNIHSNNCGGGLPPAPGAMAAAPTVNPSSEIVLECDRDKGEIYVRPVDPTPGGSGKPVNLFVSSAQATYTLLLRRSDTPADTIVIRDKTARQALPASTVNSGAQGPLGPSANHVRAMKAMLVAMASDRVPADIRVDDVNRPMQLWAEAKFSLMRRYEGRGLVGEKYLLQNVSPAVMVLAEQEFDREGGGVVGVAVENHNLRPGESTNVFVIRRGAER